MAAAIARDPAGGKIHVHDEVLTGHGESSRVVDGIVARPAEYEIVAVAAWREEQISDECRVGHQKITAGPPVEPIGAGGAEERVVSGGTRDHVIAWRADDLLERVIDDR